MEDKDFEKLRMLLGTGAENARGKQELAGIMEISERKLREFILELIKQGLPVASSSNRDFVKLAIPFFAFAFIFFHLAVPNL